jgi:sec-independent protein translocase protein TatB
MFDIGWQELFIVGVLALLVVGPRDLPRTFRTVMGYVRKAKGMAREFQNGIDEVAKEVELDDIRKEANRIGRMDLQEEVKVIVDPLGTLNQDLDMSDVQSAIQETADAMNKDENKNEGEAPSTTETETPVVGSAEPVESQPETKING